MGLSISRASRTMKMLDAPVETAAKPHTPTLREGAQQVGALEGADAQEVPRLTAAHHQVRTSRAPPAAHLLMRPQLIPQCLATLPLQRRARCSRPGRHRALMGAAGART